MGIKNYSLKSSIAWIVTDMYALVTISKAMSTSERILIDFRTSDINKFQGKEVVNPHILAAPIIS
jgi:hypothetical protein